MKRQSCSCAHVSECALSTPGVAETVMQHLYKDIFLEIHTLVKNCNLVEVMLPVKVFSTGMSTNANCMRTLFFPTQQINS